jgi:hypothetical protein
MSLRKFRRSAIRRTRSAEGCGEGVRLFEELGRQRIELDRTRTIETPSATHLRFTIVK